jgi:hypothetical protein
MGGYMKIHVRSIVAIASAVVVLTPSPGLAEARVAGHAVVRDKVGDATKGYDITRVRVKQTRKLVTVDFHVRGLSKKRDGAVLNVAGDVFKFDGIPNYADLHVLTWVTAKHKVRIKMYEGEDGLPTSCRRLRAHWYFGSHNVRIISPVQCGNADWFRRKFYAETTRSPFGKTQDHVKTFKIHE